MATAGLVKNNNVVENDTILCRIAAVTRKFEQVLVYHDLLGMMQHPHHAKVTPKFCKQYANLGIDIERALKEFNAEVKMRSFPSPAHSPYKMAGTIFYPSHRLHYGASIMLDTWLLETQGCETLACAMVTLELDMIHILWQSCSMLFAESELAKLTTLLEEKDLPEAAGGLQWVCNSRTEA